MALNTSKCNHLMPLHFKGLTTVKRDIQNTHKMQEAPITDKQYTRGHAFLTGCLYSDTMVTKTN